MDEDAAFLRAIMAAPDEAAPKLIYADWLDERGRAEEAAFLRAEFGPEPLSGGAWPGLDPGWRAFMDTLARPILRMHPRCWFTDVSHADSPFHAPISRRGKILIPRPQLRRPEEWDDSLLADLGALMDLGPATCSRGPYNADLVPFACNCNADPGPLTGVAVLNALGTSRFRSEHISDLEWSLIPFPGYQPGTDNDEVHTDPAGQGMFKVDETGPIDEAHIRLANAVEGRLWYVLLHPTKEPRGFADRVALFAVGRSPNGRRLLGLATHQACHNFCD